MPFDDPRNRTTAIQTLCNQLVQNPNPNIRCAAAEALGDIGAEEAISALASAADWDDSTAVREAAIRAIGKIGRPAETPSTAINQVYIYGDVSVAQYFVEATVQIQQILNQIAQTNSTDPHNLDAIALIIKDELKQNPALKARLISALKAGGLEALKAIFNHPIVTIPVEMIMGFLEP